MVDLLPAFQSYFGARPGGVDLRSSLARLPLERLGDFAAELAARRATPASGRVFFMGNGGSYDNARLMAQLCRARGIDAKVPGYADDYLAVAQAEGYAAIYRRGLEQDGLRAGDLVVGISGSGNSENILAALGLARERGATAWCMGGRDGGRMRPLCGDEHALIGANDCMEAIEDLHMAMLIIALSAGSGGGLGGCTAAHADLLGRLDAFMAPANLRALAEIGAGMLDTIRRRGHTFVLGTGIGANHFRADMGRGATNTLPIRGLSTPELFTMNSAQATANDDGLDFVLADGLVKLDPGPDDFAILCDLPGARAAIEHCRDVLRVSGTPHRSVGASGVVLDAFGPAGADFALSMLGHACGEVLRGTLVGEWKARVIEHLPEFPRGQKKLGIDATDRLEAELRGSGVIAADELLTFCYGRVYAVRTPTGHAQARCYF